MRTPPLDPDWVVALMKHPGKQTEPRTEPKCYTLHLRVRRTVLCTCKLIQELNQAEGEADDEGVDEMAGTRAVLQKCILILFRRLDETWPCLMC